MPSKPDGPIGVFVAVFSDEDGADKGLEALRFYQRKAKIMDIYDDAKILRKDDGKIEVRGARGGRHGAREGALVGAVLGVVFPPSLIVTGAAGAVVGAAAGKLHKGMLDHSFLSDMGEYLQPGRGAIIAISDAKNMETFAGEVPNALRSFTHTFASANTDEIAEWISSIPETVRAEDSDSET
ncbi:MAG TPA: DUF1269 domain-containing protein [Actinomycetota bacterium]